MNIIRLIAVPLALVAVIAVACGDDGAKGTPEAGSPSASVTAGASPTSAAGGALSAGTHTSESFATAVSLTVGEGWKLVVDAPDIFVVERTPQPGSTFGYIAFLYPPEVYDPTETELLLEPPPADFVTWFNDHRLLTIVDTQPVTLGGIEGTAFEITAGNTSGFVSDFPLFKQSDGDYELSYRDHIRMDVVDRGGKELLVTYGSDKPDNFDAFEPLATEVLNTVEFGE